MFVIGIFMEKVKGWIDQILQVEPPSHARDMGSTCKQATDLVRNVLQKGKSILLVCCTCVNLD